jgi:hypothetical protein
MTSLLRASTLEYGQDYQDTLQCYLISRIYYVENSFLDNHTRPGIYKKQKMTYPIRVKDHSILIMNGI